MTSSKKPNSTGKNALIRILRVLPYVMITVSIIVFFGGIISYVSIVSSSGGEGRGLAMLIFLGSLVFSAALLFCAAKLTWSVVLGEDEK